MSNTRKDRPLRVRIRQAATTREVHIGCPLAEEPRLRRVRRETTSEPHWHLEEVHYRPDTETGHDLRVTDSAQFWMCKTRQEWTFGPVVTVKDSWEPFWIEVCDIDQAGNRAWERCHREADWKDPAVQKPGRGSKHRLRTFDDAERSAVRIKLDQARRDQNTNHDTDVQPDHRPADPWNNSR